MTLAQVEHFAVEGAGSTHVHPLGLAALLLCGVLMLTVPRKYALWTFIVLICFVSTRQAVAIAGFNLYFPRFMILVFGLGRAMLHAELMSIRLNRLDWLVIAYGFLYFTLGAINWGFDPTVLKTRSGYVSEVIGTYFLCRMLIRTREDVRMAVYGLAGVSIILCAFFILEHTTRRNVFSIFGGVPAITWERDGRLRCQGAFAHPILAGVFWSAILPLFVWGVWCDVRRRPLLTAGLVTSLGVIVLTASSTPALGAAAVCLGWAFYPLRHYIRYIFAAVGFVLFLLHIVMKAPVWSLIQRINVTSGNSGYHRYILVDGFITHWREWWLLGSRIGTEHWGHFTFDTANQFVSAGVAAGILTLAVFIAISVVSLNACGRISRTSPQLGWALGVSVFATSVCYLGISIWGQLHFAWALPLAIAGSLGFDPVLHRPRGVVRSRTASVRQGAPQAPPGTAILRNGMERGT